MSTLVKTPGEAASAAAADPATPQTPTTTYYQQLADDFSKKLDEIAAILPRLESAHPATTTFVRTHVNVSMDFLGTAIAVVEQTPELQGVNRFDVTAARDTLQFIEAFRPVQDKVTAFAKSLAFTISSRKANLTADALQIYSIAKGVARDPGSAEVASHVANLKRDLGRKRKSKKAAAASESAPAAPAAAEPRS